MKKLTHKWAYPEIQIDIQIQSENPDLAQKIFEVARKKIEADLVHYNVIMEPKKGCCGD